MRWKIRGSDLGRGKRFFSKTPRPTQPHFQWVPVVKLPESDDENSHPPSADVKNAWNYASTPPTCPYGVERDSVVFSF